MIISSINLWCTKNLVDTQFLLWMVFSDEEFASWKIRYHTDPDNDEVDLVFINTCWFISSARDEMFETIERLLQWNKKVYVVWCALQYFQNLLKEEQIVRDIKTPSYQGWLRWQKLVKDNSVFFLDWKDFDALNYERLQSGYVSSDFEEFEFSKSPRAYTSLQLGFEYIKIAEGCMNSCSFCIIPQIRWKQKSLSIESVMWQVLDLVQQWVKEIILIAQDTARYWMDLYEKSMLLDLLREINELPEDFTFRVLYLYPDVLTWSFIEELAKLDRFIPYFDIPLQHISQSVLQRMRRFPDKDKILWILNSIKKYFSEYYIRTNFIVWFPGETEKDIEELSKFIEDDWFDNIAFFEYHDEPLAQSFKLSDKLSDEVVRDRFQKLNNLWKPLFEEKEKTRQRKEQQGSIVELVDDSTIKVRPFLHAPEIDVYDEISTDKIIWVEEWIADLDLGVFVAYKM